MARNEQNRDEYESDIKAVGYKEAGRHDGERLTMYKEKSRECGMSTCPERICDGLRSLGVSR